MSHRVLHSHWITYWASIGVQVRYACVSRPSKRFQTLNRLRRCVLHLYNEQAQVYKFATDAYRAHLNGTYNLIRCRQCLTGVKVPFPHHKYSLHYNVFKDIYLWTFIYSKNSVLCSIDCLFLGTQSDKFRWVNPREGVLSLLGLHWSEQKGVPSAKFSQRDFFKKLSLTTYSYTFFFLPRRTFFAWHKAWSCAHTYPVGDSIEVRTWQLAPDVLSLKSVLSDQKRKSTLTKSRALAFQWFHFPSSNTHAKYLL